MKKLSYLSKSLLLYLAICGVLLILSLIGLFFNNYYLVTCFAIGSVCGFINLFLLIKSSEGIDPDAKKSQMVMLVGGNFVRFIVMFLAVGLSALVIYLTNVEKEKLDYLNIIASGVPFIVNIFVASLVHIESSQDEIKNEDNTSSPSESEISSQDKKDE